MIHLILHFQAFTGVSENKGNAGYFAKTRRVQGKTAGSLPAAENFQRRNRPYLWNRQVFDFSDTPQKVKPLAPLKQGTRGQIPAVPPKLAHKRPLYSRSYGLASNAAKRRAIFPPALMEPFAAQPAPRLTERGSLCRFASGTISNHRF